ncbi:MAG: ATP-dependent DNA helicase PcrA [Gemmatimonadetes bacterium]|nr:MAG: ATP-dependent DNA helicase PcrA [Gemmatimonadota bacterium]
MTTTAHYLDALNPEQRVAVEHLEGPILVLAGAGSGKTRVLTTRIGHLVHEHGVPPDRILAVTFTNKAAGEMRERVARLLGRDPRGLWLGTFHALGARILRRHAPTLGWSRTFTIFDAEQSLRTVKRAAESVGVDTRRWSPKALRAHISGAKNQLVGPDAFAEEHGDSFDLFTRTVARVYPAYQALLEEQNAFDFDDLLVGPVTLFREAPDVLRAYRDRFAFVLVDEYQDTNRAQFVFLELLAREHGNLMVVGDDDQSIYGWRGADIGNILDFERAFPGARVVRLERNYRSTEVILSAANAVIARNTQRKGKTLRTDRAGGAPITLTAAADETDEARWVVDRIRDRVEGEGGLSWRDFAILYRTNAQSRAMEDAFRRAGVPYQIIGGVRFYERREIQDVLAYLRLISNPRDREAFDRIVNYPRRGVGQATLERLTAWAEAQGIDLLEAARRAGEAPDVPAAGARGLQRFADLVQRYSALAVELGVGALLERLIEELDILRLLRDEGPEGEDRANNVRELVAGALDFNAELLEELDEDDLDTFSELDLFLQRVALVADVDRHDPDADAVTLMTLHNAKGLEFPVVFVTGLEDGLFPLARAYDEPAELEEERRLFYVGITRARDELLLTWAGRRRRAGDMMYGRLSPFVEDIPEALLRAGETELQRASSGYRRRPSDRGPGAGQGRGFGPTGRSTAAREDWDAPALADLDLDLDQDAPRLVKGERVLHETFGSGTVRELSGFGRDLKVTVEFDEVGPKKLLVRYARLRRDVDG